VAYEVTAGSEETEAKSLNLLLGCFCMPWEGQSDPPDPTAPKLRRGFRVVLLWAVPSTSAILIHSAGNVFRKPSFSLTPEMLVMSIYLYYCDA